MSFSYDSTDMNVRLLYTSTSQVLGALLSSFLSVSLSLWHTLTRFSVFLFTSPFLWPAVHLAGVENALSTGEDSL